MYLHFYILLFTLWEFLVEKRKSETSCLARPRRGPWVRPLADVTLTKVGELAASVRYINFFREKVQVEE